MKAMRAVIIAGLLSVLVSYSAQERAVDCARESLQAIIDTARDGDSIALAPGVCTENLTITKNLTVEGAGSERTVIRGGKPGFPVIFVQSDVPITVILRNLALTEALRASESPQHGKECAIFYPELLCPSGLQARGVARVTLDSVRIARNPWVGVYVLDAAHVSAQNSDITGNGWGVYVSPDASIELRDSRVERSRENGLEIWGTASVTRTLIKASRRSGIESLGTVRIFESEIAQNKGSGVLLTGASQTELGSNIIAENGLWGVAATLRKCGYLSDNFRGSVVLDQNRISSNRLGDICLP